MEVFMYVQIYMYFFITSNNCTKLWDRDSSSLGKNYLPRIFFWWCCSNDRFWLPFQQRETVNFADTMYIHFWCTKTHPTIIKSYIAKMVLGHHENHFGKDISKNSRGKGRPWVTSLWDAEIGKLSPKCMHPKPHRPGIFLKQEKETLAPFICSRQEIWKAVIILWQGRIHSCICVTFIIVNKPFLFYFNINIGSKWNCAKAY